MADKSRNKISQFFYSEFIGTWKGIGKESVSTPILLLVIFNVVFLLISNIIAVKTINLTGNSGYIGDIRLFLPAAVIVYVLGNICVSDTLCEIGDSSTGNKGIWTRRSCHIGFALNLLMILIFLITAVIPGVLNGAIDSGFSGNFWNVLGSTPLTLLASMISFYFGDLLNDTLFKRMREKDGRGSGKLVKRCVVSTLFGQLVDAGIFIILGLHVFPILTGQGSFVDFVHAASGNALVDLLNGWGWLNTLIAICLQWIVKVVCEFIISPLIILICKKHYSTEKYYVAE